MTKISVFVERIFTSSILFLLSAPALSANEDLKAELGGLKSELSSITGQLNTFRTGELAVRRDIELTANVSFLQQWLAYISTPYAEISAVATRVEDDLFYAPGRYRVWIEDPSQTNVWVRWSRFSVTAMPDRLHISGTLIAHAESRVRMRAGGIVNTNILCETKPNLNVDVQASLLTSPVVNLYLPYTIVLTKPTDAKGKAVCHLGRLGDKKMDFPLGDLARVLSTGKINLGYSDKIRIDIPTSPPTVRYLDVSIREPKSEISAEHIRVEADLTIGAPGVEQKSIESGQGK